MSVLEAAGSMTSLAARINEVCGSTALLASAVKPQLSAMDVAFGSRSISEIIAAQSRWSVETINPVVTSMSAIIKSVTEPQYPALAALEKNTSLLAHNNGIARITSVATQISSISGILA